MIGPFTVVAQVDFFVVGTGLVQGEESLLILEENVLNLRVFLLQIEFDLLIDIEAEEDVLRGEDFEVEAKHLECRQVVFQVA